MPPNTAIRVSSGIVTSASWVTTERAVLVAGVTRLVPQSIRSQRIGQRPAEMGVVCLEEDRAYQHTTVRDEPAVVAKKVSLVEVAQHVNRDALFRPVAALPLDLGAE